MRISKTEIRLILAVNRDQLNSWRGDLKKRSLWCVVLEKGSFFG